MAHDRCDARSGRAAKIARPRARGGGVGAALRSLLPTHPQYAGLKRALATRREPALPRPDPHELDRWRWTAAHLGARHVLVNVPAFTAALIDDGHVAAATAPWSARSRRRRRSSTRDHRGDHQSVVERAAKHHPVAGRRLGAGYSEPQRERRDQRPPAAGAAQRAWPGQDRNAQSMGHLPARHAVAGPVRPDRARVQPWLHPHPERPRFRRFAARPNRASERADIDRAVETGRNQQTPLAHPVPVYIAYFTAAATSDGDVVS